ncbi:DUF58 domain-containing protein [Crocosphaera sp. Alani8]|uniref:DUF58 domain-containing protein n=1 Tax=Crocosphaera sp. Alani8 TaxID=3038952 RepID=UPI00313D1D3E
MIIPAKRSYFILILALFISVLVALFNVKISLLLLLLFDVTFLGVMVIDGSKVKKNRVIISRHSRQKLSIGRENKVTLSITAKQQAAQVVIKDNYPQQFSVSVPTLKTSLTPQTQQELHYTVSPHQRGEFRWGDIRIRQLSPWALAWYDWKVVASQKVAVYPDLVGLRSLLIRLSQENTGTMRLRRRLVQGTEFRELREYVSGEDTRLINWKASAKSTHPIVKVLEEERKQTLIILLDRGRLMTAQVQGLKRFDWALNSTLSLASTGLNRGDSVGIGVFDREVVAWMPPERGKSQLSRIIERLTPIQPVLLEPDYFGSVTRLVNQQHRRALVVLITDVIDQIASAELLTAMQRLTPRYLPFCVTLRDPQVDEIAHSQTETIDDLYRRSVALDVLSQRQMALAQLKQKGVLVLDAAANQISEQLVERYLEIKARHLL